MCVNLKLNEMIEANFLSIAISYRHESTPGIAADPSFSGDRKVPMTIETHL